MQRRSVGKKEEIITVSYCHRCYFQFLEGKHLEKVSLETALAIGNILLVEKRIQPQKCDSELLYAYFFVTLPWLNTFTPSGGIYVRKINFSYFHRVNLWNLCMELISNQDYGLIMYVVINPVELQSVESKLFVESKSSAQFQSFCTLSVSCVGKSLRKWFWLIIRLDHFCWSMVSFAAGGGLNISEEVWGLSHCIEKKIKLWCLMKETWLL